MLIAALEIWLLLRLATNCCKDNNTLYHKAQRLLSVVLNLERGSSVTFTTHQLLPSSSLSSSLDAISHHHQPEQQRATKSIHHYYLLVTLGTCGDLQLLAKVFFCFFCSFFWGGHICQTWSHAQSHFRPCSLVLSPSPLFCTFTFRCRVSWLLHSSVWAK